MLHCSNMMLIVTLWFLSNTHSCTINRQFRIEIEFETKTWVTDLKVCFTSPGLGVHLDDNSFDKNSQGTPGTGFNYKGQSLQLFAFRNASHFWKLSFKTTQPKLEHFQMHRWIFWTVTHSLAGLARLYRSLWLWMLCWGNWDDRVCEQEQCLFVIAWSCCAALWQSMLEVITRWHSCHDAQLFDVWKKYPLTQFWAKMINCAQMDETQWGCREEFVFCNKWRKLKEMYKSQKRQNKYEK